YRPGHRPEDDLLGRRQQVVVSQRVHRREGLGRQHGDASISASTRARRPFHPRGPTRPGCSPSGGILTGPEWALEPSAIEHVPLTGATYMALMSASTLRLRRWGTKSTEAYRPSMTARVDVDVDVMGPARSIRRPDRAPRPAPRRGSARADRGA